MRYNYPRCNRDFHDRFGWFVSWAIVDRDGHARYAIHDVRPPFPSTVYIYILFRPGRKRRANARARLRTRLNLFRCALIARLLFY